MSKAIKCLSYEIITDSIQHKRVGRAVFKRVLIEMRKIQIDYLL